MQDVTAIQRGGWCNLESCEEGAAVRGDVVVLSRGDETWEIEVCDACLIRLSSARDPGEFEELEKTLVRQRTQIDNYEVKIEGVIAANEEHLRTIKEGSSG